jgi:hypothetical protein
MGFVMCCLHRLESAKQRAAEQERVRREREASLAVRAGSNPLTH